MHIEKVAVSIAVIILVLAVLLIVRSFLFRILHKWAEKTKTGFDNLIINTIKSPSIFWCIGIALYIGLESSEIPLKYTFYIIKAIHILIILSITVVAANLVTRVFIRYIDRSSVSVQSTGLLNTIIKTANTSIITAIETATFSICITIYYFTETMVLSEDAYLARASYTSSAVTIFPPGLPYK